MGAPHGGIEPREPLCCGKAGFAAQLSGALAAIGEVLGHGGIEEHHRLAGIAAAFGCAQAQHIDPCAPADVGGRAAERGGFRAAREGITEQTIAGVPELANTVSQGAVAAGFFSLAGESFLFLDDDSDEKLDKAVKEIDSLAALPGRGDGIIPWQIVSEEIQNGGSRSRMKAKLSLAVLGDIAEMAKK